ILDGQMSVKIFTAIMEKQSRWLDPGGNPTTAFAHEFVGLLPDVFHGFWKHRAAVLAAKLFEPLFSGAAASDLRAKITQRGFREANIVFDQAQDFSVRFAFRVNLYGTNLQSFFVDVPGHARSEARARAADVDPVCAHPQEANELGLPEERRIDHHVIEMLAADLRVIDQENIASMDVVETVDLHTVLYRHAEIGEKNRQGAFI